MSLLRKSGAAKEGARPALDPAQARAARQQRSAQRATQMARTREARKGAGNMKPPEPLRAVLVGAVMLGIAVFSYVSKDVVQKTETVKHKSVLVNVPSVHPGIAIVLAVLVVATLASVYFRKRLVTVIGFMLSAAIGVDAPLPSNAINLRWVTFILPAGYALWVWAFRMRKDQNAWLAEHPLSTGQGARVTTAAGSRAQRAGAANAAARSRKAKDEPVVGPNGKVLPPNSGRYTRPQITARAAQRRPVKGSDRPH